MPASPSRALVARSALFALTTLAAVVGAHALSSSTAHAFYCGQRLVSRGDAPSRIRSICGEPTEVRRRTVTRTRTVARRVVRGVVVYDTERVEVEVLEWYYDFGRNRFTRTLRFENGRLVQIITGRYGQGPPS